MFVYIDGNPNCSAEWLRLQMFCNDITHYPTKCLGACPLHNVGQTPIISKVDARLQLRYIISVQTKNPYIAYKIFSS